MIRIDINRGKIQEQEFTPDQVQVIELSPAEDAPGFLEQAALLLKLIEQNQGNTVKLVTLERVEYR